MEKNYAIFHWTIKAWNIASFFKLKAFTHKLMCVKKYIVRKVNTAFRAGLFETANIHKRFIPVVK